MKKSSSFSADLASAAAAGAAAGTATPKQKNVQRGRFTVVQNPTEEVVETIRDGIDSDDEFFSDDDFGFGLNDEAAEERAKEIDFIFDKNNRREHFAMPKNWNAIKKELKKFRDSLEKDGHFYFFIENVMNSKNKEEIKDNIKIALSEFSEPKYINGEYKRLIEIYKKLRVSKKVAISNMRKRALRNSRSRSRNRRGGKRKKTRKKRKKRRKYISNIRKYKSKRKRNKRRRSINKVLHNYLARLHHLYLCKGPFSK